jgi:phosphoenolpyruvate-protein phosphotransferase
MLAGFLVSALIPSLLAFGKVNPVTILLVSVSIALLLSVISIYRVMYTLDKVQSHLSLSATHSGDEHDELRLIDESLVHFEEYFERSRVDIKVATHGGFEEDDLAVTSYAANLQTGAPICAEVWELPKQMTNELVSSARLTGVEARIVFAKAVENVVVNLEELKGYSLLSESDKGIIDFQVMILRDPSFGEKIEKKFAKGKNLLSVISEIFEKFISQLEQQSNSYMKERVADFKDLKQRLFEAVHDLSGEDKTDRYLGAKGKIAICRHVLPSEVISLCNAGVAGIVSLENTSSSHAQILLSSLNVSSLSSIQNFPLASLHGHTVLLDTLKGTLIIEPLPSEVNKILEIYRSRKADVVKEAVTLKSGEAFAVGVTVNNPLIETQYAVDAYPDFVGLFRTEMHFIGQKKLPTEDELESVYGSLISSFDDSLVVVRMLDLGADKISGFEPLSGSEENPCMGQRSMRLLLQKPELFRLQLRAILKASHKKVCLLYPMISGWSELSLIDDFLNKTLDELREEGHDVTMPIKGIMVEVPSIVTRFEDYVDYFDVFNIGTNDLTQYTLAADRNNDAVSGYYKAYHPSLLTMIKKVATLCKKKGKRAVICGQMGADLRLLPLLVGLGIENISVNWPKVSQLKGRIQELDFDECNEIAERALACKSLVEVEAVLKL